MDVRYRTALAAKRLRRMAWLQAALDAGAGLADPIVILMLHVLGTCRDITFRAEILPRSGKTLTFQPRRPNGVVHEIVVDLDATLFEIDTKQRPVGKWVKQVHLLSASALKGSLPMVSVRYKLTRVAANAWALVKISAHEK